MVYLLLSPTIFEAKELLAWINIRDRWTFRSFEAFSGEVCGKEVVLAISGVGKVNTAHALTILFVRCPVELLVLFGCGGAYRGSGGSIGDVMIATEEVYGDEGVLTEDGWSSMEEIRIPLLKRGDKTCFNSFDLEGKVLEQVRRITEGISEPNIFYGRFLTVSTCSGSLKAGDELYDRFGAICENMEGAAAAHVARIYDLDMIEIRGISNLIEDRVFERWDIQRAVKSCSKVVIEVLGGLGEGKGDR